MRRAVLSLLFFYCLSSLTYAQTLDLAFISNLKSRAETDPAAALKLAEAKLKELSQQKPLDSQTIYSLLDFQRQIAAKTGDKTSEARVLVTMASFAASNRDTLSTDPLPLLQEAAIAFETVGDLRNAQAALDSALELATGNDRDKAVRIDLVTAALELAKKRGNTSAAQRYETALSDLLTEPLVIVDPNKKPDPNTATRGSKEGYKPVKIFYATDRAREKSTKPSQMFGGRRGKLQYGTAIVTIPENHKSGAVESPSIWRLEFSESSNKHVILKSVTPKKSDAYFSEMRADLDGKLSKEAFIFIHGFNVSFEKAIKRAAQLAHDMQFDGIPIAYSWPSRHSVLEYVADTAVVRLSGRRLAGFLEKVVQESGAKTVHIVAHSMGNRALTDALELIAAKKSLSGGEKPPFDQVVFAAPDVDADLFVEMIKSIRPLARRLTLYASRNDWALKVSQKIHGDSKRAGQGGKGTVVSNTMDSIDMSGLGGDMLAHGYFAKETSALLDLASLFWQNADPAIRCGLERKTSEQANGHFWVYKPGSCDTDVFLPLLAHIRSRSLSTQKEINNLIAELKIDQTKYPEVGAVMGRLLQPE